MNILFYVTFIICLFKAHCSHFPVTLLWNVWVVAFYDGMCLAITGHFVSGTPKGFKILGRKTIHFTRQNGLCVYFILYQFDLCYFNMVVCFSQVLYALFTRL